MAARFRSSVRARRPTATSSASAFRVSSPSAPVTPIATPPSAFSRLAGSARVPVSTRMPRLPKALASSAETSGSSAGTIRSRISTMVTSVPKSRYMLANSTPTAPLPSTISEPGGSAALVVTSSLDRTCSPSMSSPGSVATAEPVAMST